MVPVLPTQRNGIDTPRVIVCLSPPTVGGEAAMNM
ncbi:TPA_asm: hypothetical protein HUJ06_000135 [Nelumbo nucifera]|uniref:Uncharacterized protein n=1 Tax=Nelumbo nucifera TaxID=4432 RepID=A0A823A2N3_NELNU|nr:TPA_asm: hypothetical protein HUJ06_019215 [Nelumbo nucifera]DAD30287.1 TPA_asm: hypothetical protein HUJ06_031755 [Nelumbo nucifera]DAD33976.1 TPA_asm: hypothetical protein HUJ06_004616 [Nelumbo nucifera]DAD33978.1 TPA_asm: hypothetical protein HUJ06_004618 [Nelumbo nucifera]DAD33997.1 TPA_asm: hypothetical protein HUJ06_004637 [Nelumbo nucifera]